jgi:hypothetical protein
MKQLRDQFKPGGRINPTCAKCDSFQGLELYRTGEGRLRAQLNRERSAGQIVKRKDMAAGISSGG